MNYASWNDLIYKYYFESNSDSKVMLHITMQDLIDFAKEENVEIAKGRFAKEYDDDKIDNIIKNDFVCKFWTSPREVPDFKTFVGKINSLKTTAIREQNYKNLLAIVAMLIMPICEDDNLDLNANAYYEHLSTFLHTYGFISPTSDNVVRTLLDRIRLEEIWEWINKWTSQENLPFQSANLRNGRGVERVNSLKNECLLSPSHLRRFCILFERGGLAPRANIENDRLISAFKNHYNCIGLSDSRSAILLNNPEYLGVTLRQAYDSWDGSTRVREKIRGTRKVKEYAENTCYPLQLVMVYDSVSNSKTFGVHLYCSDIDNADLTFKKDGTNEELDTVYISSDGYADSTFYLDDETIRNIFQGNDVFSIHEVDSSTTKARFVVTDYYLLKAFKGEGQYVATDQLVKGQFYYVLLRNNKVETFNEWLDANKAEQICDNLFDGLYSLYKIERAEQDMAQYSNLRFNPEVKCKSANNIVVKYDDTSRTVLLSNLLPAQFKISGVDVGKDKIYAVSTNSEYQFSTELKYDSVKELWILDVFSNLFQRDAKFQIYRNEAPIPYGGTYKFSDFILPENFYELGLNKWGEIDESAFSSGLFISEQEMADNNINVNWRGLEQQMAQAPEKEIKSVGYKGTDILLYAITSASYKSIEKKPIVEIIKRILSENEARGVVSQYQGSKGYDDLFADYFRMGYVNYAYTSRGLCLSANRPTLILLSPEFIKEAISDTGLTSNKCVERDYKCLLSGGRTISLVDDIVKYQSYFGYRVEVVDTDILMPQTIYIHADNREAFNRLAEKLNIGYQDNIYANALLGLLPEVDDYIEHIKENEYEVDYFGVKDFKSIDYSRLAELYSQRNGGWVKTIEIEKPDYDRNNDIVTFYPTKSGLTMHAFIHEGRMYKIDKYWGHFIGMKLANVEVLKYDDATAQIRMPSMLRLPILFARALTLLTGQTPISTNGSRAYNIGLNPYTRVIASHPDNILRKLGQK